jgi:predicted dehydrogenase
MRVGLVGTGYWARSVHAPGVVGANGASLTAVWGRTPSAVAEIAESHGVAAHDDFERFLADVDAVSFCVPPDVQAPLAVRAAEAGKHLLLEKPISLDESAGDKICAAVDANNVAALVFFTHLFAPPTAAWFESVEKERWLGGDAYWLGSALEDENPFNTPWRRQYGGLWDVGPHAVSGLWQALGPVVRVTADSGAPDVTHLVLHHESGASSTCTLTLSAPDAADGYTMMLWGPAGRSRMPVDAVDSLTAHTVAIEELASLAGSGLREHRADLRLGRNVLHILAVAQQQLNQRSAHEVD